MIDVLEEDPRLVILFAGALEHMYRPALSQFFAKDNTVHASGEEA